MARRSDKKGFAADPDLLARKVAGPDGEDARWPDDQVIDLGDAITDGDGVQDIPFGADAVKSVADEQFSEGRPIVVTIILRDRIGAEDASEPRLWRKILLSRDDFPHDRLTGHASAQRAVAGHASPLTGREKE